MATIDLGKVVGDPGVSMRLRNAWAANTAYVNNSQYIDVVTNGGNSYACKTSHTSGASFSTTNWTMIAQKGATGAKGDTGAVPTIKAGTATSLESTAAPTVTASTSGNTTTFNFGIPKGDTSDIKTPTFTDTVSTYSTLATANTAAETASNAIKSKTNFFTILSNMKKSFSAIVQGLKILGTNVGAITGITSDLAGESETVAASIKAVNQLNSKLNIIGALTKDIKGSTQYVANTTQQVCKITLQPGTYLILFSIVSSPIIGDIRIKRNGTEIARSYCGDNGGGTVYNCNTVTTISDQSDVVTYITPKNNGSCEGRLYAIRIA